MRTNIFPWSTCMTLTNITKSLKLTLSFIIWITGNQMKAIQIVGMKIPSWQTFFFYWYLWPWQISQGHQSLNLTLSFIIWITGINIVIQIVGVEISWWQLFVGRITQKLIFNAHSSAEAYQIIAMTRTTGRTDGRITWKHIAFASSTGEE